MGAKGKEELGQNPRVSSASKLCKAVDPLAT